jgi:tRNA(Glu) U13 pseudouridine synthase TruD
VDKPHFTKGAHCSQHGKVLSRLSTLPVSSATPDWPADRPNFLQFVLFKENKDTMDAISGLSRRMFVNNKVSLICFV